MFKYEILEIVYYNISLDQLVIVESVYPEIVSIFLEMIQDDNVKYIGTMNDV